MYYIQGSDKLRMWDIKGPKLMDYAGHVAIRDRYMKR
jgi:hypothetical protein